jgi:hypothetical protein
MRNRLLEPRVRVRLQGALVLLVVAAAVTTGTAVASGSGSAARPHASPLSAGPRPSAREIGTLDRAYPVLLTRARPVLTPAMAGPFLLHEGAQVALGRLAERTSHGVGVFLVPSAGSICMTTTDGAIAQCGSYPAAPGRAVAAESSICGPQTPGDYEVAWTLPPGVSTASVTYSDGSTENVAVTNGVVDLEGPRSGPLPGTLSWTGPNGAGSSWSGLPANTATTHCAA